MSRLDSRLSRSVVFVAVALLVAGVASAVPTAGEALDRARAVYVEEGPSAALPLFEQALALYRNAGDRHGEAVVLGLIGNCHKRLGEPERALELLGQALAMKRELGDRVEEGKTLSHLGLVYWEQADYESAIRHFELAIAVGREVGDARLAGSGHNNLGLVYDELGDYSRSASEYRQALDLYRRTDFPRGESDTLGNLGGIQLLLGRYREAIALYGRALEISERLGSKPSMSQDLGNLAISHAGLGDREQAIALFDRALVLARESGLAKEEADWLKGKGALLVESGRHAEGLALFEQALERYEASGLRRERVEALLELAQVHLELGDALAAEQRLRSALELARQIGHARGELSARVALGELEWRQKRLEPARALFAEALRDAGATGDAGLAIEAGIDLARVDADLGRFDAARDEAVAALAAARGTGAKLRVAEALFARGEIERRTDRFDAALASYREGEDLAAGFGEPDVAWRLAHGVGRALEALGRDREAVAAYRRAVERIESVRGRLRDERFRAGYIEDRHEAYVDLVRLLLRTGDDDAAFSAAERLRARSYLDLLSHGEARAPTGAEARRERELRRRIQVLQQGLEAEGLEPEDESRRAATAYTTELATVEQEYQSLLAGLRTTDATLAATWSLAVPDSRTVRDRLPPDTALVEYVVGDRELLRFVLTRDRLTTRSIPLARRDLEAKVGLLRDLIRDRASDAWRGPAGSLARLLLDATNSSDDLDRYRRLIVVPHGVLHYLPFAVLPLGSDLAPLVARHELALVPAAGVLTHARHARSPRGSVLAAAPGRRGLRHAAEEARDVAAAQPAPKRLLVGDEATEGAFTAEAGAYRYLHVATHSSWNRLNPLLTSLELVADAEHDGHLAVHEILDLDLAADLVVLSGCETALGANYFGAVPVGDDFVGLTRAFLHAGSDGVLASLWEVDDRSTLELMRGVYRRLGALDPAAALATAQRELLADPAFAHPFYWAAFELVRGSGVTTP